MRRYWFPKPYADAVARLRVPSGFLLVALFAWLARPTVESLLWGIPISVAGLLLRGWAAGHLAKNQNLATDGPYAFLRNPLYAGTLLVGAGLVLATRSLALAVVFAAVFVFVYLPVIEQEEQHLRKLFPSFEAYANAVPLLVPRLTPAGRVGGWSGRLYLKNEEWQALAGFAAGLAYLLIRASW